MLPALPAGLVSSGCTSFAKLVVVATAVAYVMLGIDEISVQIENPFDRRHRRRVRDAWD
jgi:predicted membrane chloride channel (bestrophin family)